MSVDERVKLARSQQVNIYVNIVVMINPFNSRMISA